ncbi:hypothetical protein GCM10017668_26970 [Streptomyces tuirus]|uniref:Uncharacterized protein n=1 Tax=Streptomyces tuirus TaxID=68278 RepID=A0A7G1NGT0_9ACTN|nr:hypothetical protein GCM10017668_26970 [Streptomyces tuirus]
MGRGWGIAAGRDHCAGTRGAASGEVEAGAAASPRGARVTGVSVALRGAVRVGAGVDGRVSAGRVREALARAEAGGRPPAAARRECPLPGERGGAAAAGAGGADPGPPRAPARAVALTGVPGVPGAPGGVFEGVCGAVWAGAAGVVLP